MKRQRLTRRDFLKAAGASAVAIPVVSGYALFRSSTGEFPSISSPYDLEVDDTKETLDTTASSPILLLIGENSSNPFGAYLGEILRTEGLNCFHVGDIANLSGGMLEQNDIVLLSEVTPNTNQIELLEEFVFSGGNLIAMKPDRRLSPLLGVEPLAGEVIEGYMKVEPNHPVADGIARESLQYHGAADRYRLAGSETVTWISNSSNGQFKFPGITIHKYGNGRAAMWTFDLARSVAYTRQGNPALVNQDLDGLDGVRTVDLFKDWIDLDRISIPQADEQQRLLINLIIEMNSNKRPLPRFWYFPGQTKGILVATGDSHMNPASYIEEVLTLVEQRDGHMSIYYSPQLVSDLGRTIRRVRFFASDNLPIAGEFLTEKFTSPTPGMVQNWRSRGHEFSLHPWVEEGLEEGWNRYWKEFTGKGYGPVSPTTRTHRVLWSGWTETARVQSAYGIRMNMDYYHVGPSLQKETGEWVFGHLNGSGMPMRFVDEQGRILNIFQQNTQLNDEHLIPIDVPGWQGGWPNLTPEEAIEVSEVHLRNSIENGGYSATTFQFHVDPFYYGGEAAEKFRRWLEGTLDHAVNLDIPIRSAQEWLQFVELRRGARFESIEWHAQIRQMKFQLVVHGDEREKLDILVPLWHNEYRLSHIEVDDVKTPYGEVKVGGVTYANSSVSSITHEITASYQ